MNVGMVGQDLNLQRRGNNCGGHYVLRIVDRAGAQRRRV